MASASKTSWQPRSLEEIMHVLRQSKPGIVDRYNVKTLCIFGSYARGGQEIQRYRHTVKFSQAPSMLEFIRTEDDLSMILGIKVDLVIKNALKPIIGRNIQDEVCTISRQTRIDIILGKKQA